MNESLTRQVGGTHYTVMKMQPFEFAMRNDWDVVAFSILKYVTRSKPGERLEDLEKALHCVDIRIDLVKPQWRPQVAIMDRVSAAEYSRMNGLGQYERLALHWLETWIDNPGGDTAIRALKDSIQRLIDIHKAEADQPI